MPETPRGRLLAYGVAVLATGLSLLIRLPLVPWLDYHAELMTFFPAIIISAYLGGLGPGLVATLLGAAAGAYFFLEPRYSFAIHDLGTAYGLGLFVFTGAVISGLMESLHRWRSRIAASERRYAVTLASIGDAVIATDTQARVIYLNPVAEALTGWPLKDAMGRPLGEVFRIVNEQTRQPVDDSAAKVLRAGSMVGQANHMLLLAQGGREVPIDDCGAPIIDDRGRMAGVVLVFRDVTQRRRAEEAEVLRASEQRWRSLTEALPQLVWSATPDGACDYFSCQWTEHTGASEAELIGWRWLETLHPEDRERTRRFWLESVAGCHPYDVEYRVRHRDGQYRWFKTRGTPIRDKNGNIVKWFGTCTDITDLRRTEDALRESEERFRGTFENAAVGIAHTALDGRFLRVNEKLCDITGFGREELLAKNFQDITLADDLRADLEQLGMLLRGDSSSYSRDKRYIRKDGSIVWVAVSVSVQQDAYGKPLYMIAVIRDIAHRKRLEVDLRRAKETAEAANRAKDEFLANVSHEIRTPMNAILGLTELVLGTALTDCQQQSLRTVKSAADNLLGIINDLLDFSNIEAGKLELHPSDFALRGAVDDTLRTLAVRARAKGLKLAGHVAPDVPDALVGDAGRLRQVLLNLVGNAIKFTDAGEVKVRVEALSGGAVSEERSEAGSTTTQSLPVTTRLRFTVSDTGIGIPKDKQARIFEAFEQEDSSTTRKYGGTGLGLTIASRLIASMGGQIAVDSELGRGSTFSFTARFGRQSDLARPPSPPVPDPGPAYKPLSILVAEDNEFNAQLLEQLLAARGHHVRVASSGREAVSLSGQQAFDLCLLDVHMPELDGIQVARAIRERERTAIGHLPIIAVTAGSRQEDRERCLAAGMDDFLAKPIQSAELWAAVDRVLRKEEGGRMKDEKDKTSPAESSFILPPSSFAMGLLDPTTLVAACGGDAAILDKICQTFRTRLPGQLLAVHNAVRDHDASRLREAAHKLCGMLSTFSTVAGGTASELEDRAAECRLEDAPALVERLDAMSQQLIQLAKGLSLESLQQHPRVTGGPAS
jgi:PAS domain S-box-containing protein